MAFLLISSRVGAMISLLPGLGGGQVPPLLRMLPVLLCALLLTPVLYGQVARALPGLADSPWLLLRAVAIEIAAGLSFGLAARLCLTALPVAGQIISLMSGLSSVIVADPDLGGQVAVISRLFGVMMPVLLFSGQIFAWPLRAIATSYTLLPAGVAPYAGDTLRMLAGFADQAMAASVMLASPFLLAGLVWQAGLALLARLVPQLQIYFAALPGQILGGLALLGFLALGLVQAAMAHIGTSLVALGS